MGSAGSGRMGGQGISAGYIGDRGGRNNGESWVTGGVDPGGNVVGRRANSLGGGQRMGNIGGSLQQQGRASSQRLMEAGMYTGGDMAAANSQKSSMVTLYGTYTRALIFQNFCQMSQGHAGHAIRIDREQQQMQTSMERGGMQTMKQGSAQNANNNASMVQSGAMVGQGGMIMSTQHEAEMMQRHRHQQQQQQA